MEVEKTKFAREVIRSLAYNERKDVKHGCKNRDCVKSYCSDSHIR